MKGVWIMGFMDFLGSTVGSIGGNLAAKAKEVMVYEKEYKGLSNDALRREDEHLSKKRNTESFLRRAAIKKIMDERSGR
jgi:hypothetical protein